MNIPSKIRTAVGKSLTRLAAFNAAVMTEGDGTRSYAKALLRLRYMVRTAVSSFVLAESAIFRRPYLELENVLHTLEFLFESIM